MLFMLHDTMGTFAAIPFQSELRETVAVALGEGFVLARVHVSICTNIELQPCIFRLKKGLLQEAAPPPRTRSASKRGSRVQRIASKQLTVPAAFALTKVRGACSFVVVFERRPAAFQVSISGTEGRKEGSMD